MTENAPRELHPLEVALLVLAATLAVLGTLVWLAASLAALVFADGWPSLRCVDAIGAIFELPGHADDPRAAWPAEVQDRLPGAVAMYACALVVFAVTVFVTAAGVRKWVARDRGPAVAKWASNR